MKKILGFGFSAFLVALLSGCGGGDGGDNFNSSYSQTIVKGAVTYVCRSEKAASACEKNNDCSACEDQSGNPIVTACKKTTVSGLKTFTVTQAGCVLNLKNTAQTGVCVSGDLKLLNAQGANRARVLAEGSTFEASKLPYNVMNNEQIVCS
ncbi:hypothetical protein QR674_09770 [Acinetobacter chinensis]|uniref:Lipoprotein n=1 Tax=Acinetobacter chinensis TaxID=2004650 RepID=A0ABU3WFW9_9GAMM|nr:hypothetical protein [Acinetobacter chinensis]MDV2469273.1 hypothetical protein [Acinetobacter chinensis]